MGVEPPGVTIRLVDDADNDVAPGEAGECLIGGPDLYAGYLNRPEATAEANRGGWYHSGDVARRDARGLLYFVGRKKEIIRRWARTSRPPRSKACCARTRRSSRLPWCRFRTTLRRRGGEGLLQLRPGDALRRKRSIAFCTARTSPPSRFRASSSSATADFERTPSMRVQKQSLIKEKSDLRQGAWDRETGKVGD